MGNVVLIMFLFLVSCSSYKIAERDKENLENELMQKVENKEKNELSKSEKVLPPKAEIKKTKKSNRQKIAVFESLVKSKKREEGLEVGKAKDIGKSAPSQTSVKEEKIASYYLREVEGQINEKFIYRYNVSLLGVVMGQLDRFSQTVNSKEFILGGKLKNRSFYKYLYSIDDSLITTMDKESLFPKLVNLEKNENGSSAVSVQKVVGDKIYFFENVLKKGRKFSKERVVDFAGHYFDPLLFLRFIEVSDVSLIKNEMIPIIFRGKLYHMKVKKVEDVEKKYNGKKTILERISFDTFRNGKLKTDQKITIEKFKEGKTVIFSIEGKMKVGILYGELVE